MEEIYLWSKTLIFSDIKIPVISRDITTRLMAYWQTEAASASVDSANMREREKRRGRSSSYTRYQTRVFRYGQQPPYLASAFIPLYNNTAETVPFAFEQEDSEVSPTTPSDNGDRP